MATIHFMNFEALVAYGSMAEGMADCQRETPDRESQDRADALDRILAALAELEATGHCVAYIEYRDIGEAEAVLTNLDDNSDPDGRALNGGICIVGAAPVAPATP